MLNYSRNEEFKDHLNQVLLGKKKMQLLERWLVYDQDEQRTYSLCKNCVSFSQKKKLFSKHIQQSTRKHPIQLNLPMNIFNVIVNIISFFQL